jgi:hypothetical protein
MKKLMLIVLSLSVFAFANIKLDFMVSVKKKGCNVVKWVENDSVEGIKYRHYAKVSCKEPQTMPVKLVGLKFIDVTRNSTGEYIYTYIEE